MHEQVERRWQEQLSVYADSFFYGPHALARQFLMRETRRSDVPNGRKQKANLRVNAARVINASAESYFLLPESLRDLDQIAAVVPDIMWHWRGHTEIFDAYMMPKIVKVPDETAALALAGTVNQVINTCGRIYAYRSNNEMLSYKIAERGPAYLTEWVDGTILAKLASEFDRNVEELQAIISVTKLARIALRYTDPEAELRKHIEQKGNSPQLLRTRPRFPALPSTAQLSREVEKLLTPSNISLLTGLASEDAERLFPPYTIRRLGEIRDKETVKAKVIKIATTYSALMEENKNALPDWMIRKIARKGGEKPLERLQNIKKTAKELEDYRIPADIAIYAAYTYAPDVAHRLAQRLAEDQSARPHSISWKQWLWSIAVHPNATVAERIKKNNDDKARLLHYMFAQGQGRSAGEVSLIGGTREIEMSGNKVSITSSNDSLGVEDTSLLLRYTPGEELMQLAKHAGMSMEEIERVLVAIDYSDPESPDVNDIIVRLRRAVTELEEKGTA